MELFLRMTDQILYRSVERIKSEQAKMSIEIECKKIGKYQK